MPVNNGVGQKTTCQSFFANWLIKRGVSQGARFVENIPTNKQLNIGAIVHNHCTDKTAVSSEHM